MAMEIAKTFVVNATPEAVWSFLVDLPRVARCLPGAAIGERLDEKTSSGTMTIKVGPVSSTYRGKVVFERLDAAARTAELVATGQDVRGKGGADLRLTSSVKPLPGGKTEVTAVSLVNVTGILAQMGRGMIQDVSDEMFQNLLRADAGGAGVGRRREPDRWRRPGCSLAGPGSRAGRRGARHRGSAGGGSGPCVERESDRVHGGTPRVGSGRRPRGAGRRSARSAGGPSVGGALGASAGVLGGGTRRARRGSLSVAAPVVVGPRRDP